MLLLDIPLAITSASPALARKAEGINIFFYFCPSSLLMYLSEIDR